MKATELIAALDSLAPPELAYPWDRSGLSIGEPGAEVSKVLLALTVTREVFRAAKRAKADMIVSHHPLIWEPLETLRTDNPTTRLCLDIAEAKIACFSAHTNLDVVPGGVNEILADRLGLLQKGPLLPVPQSAQVKLVTFVPDAHLRAVRDAVCAAGAGRIGHYTHCSFSTPGVGTFRPPAEASPFSGTKLTLNEEPEHRFEVLVPKDRLPDVVSALHSAHPYEEVAYDIIPLENPSTSISLGLRGTLTKPLTLKTFAARVRKSLEIEHVRIVGDPQRSIQKVAVLGGAGGGQLRAMPKNLDVCVTGDVKYHEALDALQGGLAVIDAGHHGTEKWIVPALADYLKTHVAGVRTTIYMEADPFKVITG